MFGVYKNSKKDLETYNRLRDKDKELLVRLEKYELEFLACRGYEERYELQIQYDQEGPPVQYTFTGEYDKQTHEIIGIWENSKKEIK